MPAAPPTKDYYKVLGVADTAPAADIKKAYRKLAKRYHPDATGGDKAKESRFKEVGEAYGVIGDEKKRAEYDAQRKNPFAAGGRFPGGFPGGFAGGGFPGARPRGARRGGGTRVEVQDVDDLFSSIPRGGGGTGGGGTSGGSGGFYEMFADLFRSDAGGESGTPAPSQREDVRSRVDVELPVAALGGDLPIVVDGKRLTVKVPPGIDDGQTIRVAGRGQAGPAGAGDLLLHVHVRPHAAFRRRGDDIEVDLPVPVDEAILGGRVEVPTMEGPATVNVPPASSSGLKLRLRGKGARKRGSDERGDLYAIVQVVVPRDISPRARELIEEFGRLTRGK